MSGESGFPGSAWFAVSAGNSWGSGFSRDAAALTSGLSLLDVVAGGGIRGFGQLFLLGGGLVSGFCHDVTSLRLAVLHLLLGLVLEVVDEIVDHWEGDAN